MPSLRIAALAVCLAQPLIAQRATVEVGRDQIVVSIGPLQIPAQGSYEHHAATAPVDAAWPASGWVHGYSVDLVDSTGRALPRALLHHAAVVNLDRRQLLNPTAERLMAVGQETEEVTLPGSMGVPMTSGDRLLIYYALVNPGREDIRGATLRITSKWRPEETGRASRSVFPVAFDALPLVGSASTFDIPPGRFSIASEFTVPTSGWIRQLGAHLHDYGLEARLEDVESGKVLARLATRRDTGGHILSIERTGLLVMLRGVRLEAGHRYRVVGVYDNATCRTIAGGMAGLGGVFEPEAPRQWPRVDTRDDLYRKDLEWLGSAGAESGAHHGASAQGAHASACSQSGQRAVGDQR